MIDDLGIRLKNIRKEKGLSLRQLGKAAHVSHSFIADIEAGRSNPSLDTLRALARVLGVSISEITGDIPAVSVDQLLFQISEKPTRYILTSPSPPKETTLSKQDREELKRDAEYIKNAMMNVTGLAFNGKPHDDETLEKVMAALEEAMILAKKAAQKKYTPKKYRKED